MIKSPKGFVYVFECETGHYKIGKTTGKAEHRMQAIQTASPFNVSLFHKIECDDCGAVEKALHAVFAKKRVRGEWFLLDEWDLSRLRDFGTVTLESNIPDIPSWSDYCRDAVDEVEIIHDFYESMNMWEPF